MLPSLGNPLAMGVAPQRNQRQRESGSGRDPKRTCVTLGPNADQSVARPNGHATMLASEARALSATSSEGIS
jgi:hypothetical protein